MMKELWFQRNPLLVMSYLSLRRNGEPVYGRKIAQALGLSQSSVSTILKQLLEIEIVSVTPMGRTLCYKANAGHPILRSLRVFENQLQLQPLILLIQEFSRQIILFGSCATGDDDIHSDIDVFILTDEPDDVRQEIEVLVFDRELRPVIVDPLEMAMMEKKDKVFLAEIRKGVVMWEADDEED